ncbi:MAG: trimeric intracellular cation channel family protein [Rhodospirillaceae bacterium]|nr:trimeric intracellular cation channel family protein [Rhodospirillaceae bacterium]
MSVLYAMDLFGTAVFAVSGGLMAAKKRYDLFGFVVVGLAPAIGGGTLRDIALGSLPAFWIQDVNYLWVASLASAATFFLARHIERYVTALLVADAVGLALFTVVGAERALLLHVRPEIAMAMGVITASFGGMMRDVLCREDPLILRREIYATAAILGAALFVSIEILTGNHTAAMAIGFMATLVLRLVAIRQNLSLPTYHD